MEWTTIIVALVAAILPSGLIGIFTLREQRKNAILQNKEKEQDIKEKEDNRWEKIANQLEDQVAKMQEQLVILNERLERKDALIQEKDDIISDLRSKLDSVRTKCSLATIMRCESISCKDRIPPISQALSGSFVDKLQNYVEELGEEQ